MRKSITAGVLALSVLAGGGCVPDSEADLELVIFFALAGFPGISKAPKQSGQVTVPSSVSIGGLSGEYDIDLGTHGEFVGTATIIGQKRAKATIKDTPELLATTASLVEASVFQAVTVSKAKMTFAGSQTTGGVKKLYNVKIKASGVAVGGPNDGKKFTVTLKSKGDLENQ